MKVFELIAKLQQLPAQADVHIGWTEVSDAGTAYDTGTKASLAEQDGADEKTVVIR